MAAFRAAVLLWRGRDGGGGGPWWVLSRAPILACARGFWLPCFFSYAETISDGFLPGDNVLWHRAVFFLQADFGLAHTAGDHSARC